jgi:metallophosphoesterase superfamily enzyme
MVGLPSAAGACSRSPRKTSVRGRADDSARLPCFWLRDGLVILPAFGDFTGGAPVTREPNDRVLAIADDRLFEIPAALAA